jgi:hypothetical protein
VAARPGCEDQSQSTRQSEQRFSEQGTNAEKKVIEKQVIDANAQVQTDNILSHRTDVVCTWRPHFGVLRSIDRISYSLKSQKIEAHTEMSHECSYIDSRGKFQQRGSRPMA